MDKRFINSRGPQGRSIKLIKKCSENHPYLTFYIELFKKQK